LGVLEDKDGPLSMTSSDLVDERPMVAHQEERAVEARGAKEAKGLREKLGQVEEIRKLPLTTRFSQRPSTP
jgi:hypothetical protein